MPLLDLKTDLKSLKYGSDRPGGGDSGLPYIKTDINTVDRPFNRLRLTKFDDGLVRGGVVGALNASVVDTLRIGKFLTDFSKGPLFIVKQVGLQLSNPQLETKQLRTDRGGFFGGIANVANRINNAVGPTRIYNLGLNTIAQIPVNAFGGHFNRHGLLPIQNEDTKYEAVVTANNEKSNRLVGYKNKFKLGDGKSNETQDKKITNLIDSLSGFLPSIGGSSIIRDSTQQTINSYLGGPGSVYGIGNTTIRRYSFTEDAYRINESLEQSKQFAGKTRDEKGSPIPVFYNSKFLGSSNYASSSLNTNPGNIFNYSSNIARLTLKDNIARNKDTTDRDQPVGYEVTPVYTNDLGKGSSSISQYPDSKDEPTAIDQTAIVAYSNINPSLRKYAELANQINTINSAASLYTVDGNIVADRRDSNYPSFIESDLKTLYPLSSLKNAYTSSKSTTLGFPGSKNISIDNSPAGTLKDGKNNINALPNAFKYYGGRKTIGEYNRSNDKIIKDDTLAVVFTPINPFTGTKVSKEFLAYLTDYSETYDSGWGETRYVGRAESFYIFNSFKRSISLGLNIPCFNKTELKTNHNKLFDLGKTGLAYALAGQYNQQNLLGGVITELTVGNYLNSTPGIINNLQFSIVDNSPWDLEEKYAHHLKVTFQFTVIGNEVPIYEYVVPTPIDPLPITPPPIPQDEDDEGGTFPTSSFIPPTFPRQPPSDRDHTYVKPPIAIPESPYRARFKGFDGGSFGGGGASGRY